MALILLLEEEVLLVGPVVVLQKILNEKNIYAFLLPKRLARNVSSLAAFSSSTILSSLKSFANTSTVSADSIRGQRLAIPGLSEPELPLFALWVCCLSVECKRYQNNNSFNVKNCGFCCVQNWMFRNFVMEMEFLVVGSQKA